MSKGSDRRPRRVGRAEYERRWNLAFTETRADWEVFARECRDAEDRELEAEIEAELKEMRDLDWQDGESTRLS